VVETLGATLGFAAGKLALLSCPPPHAAMLKLAAATMTAKFSRAVRDFFIASSHETSVTANGRLPTKKAGSMPRTAVTIYCSRLAFRSALTLRAK
jgi:hypothetical protein